MRFLLALVCVAISLSSFAAVECSATLAGVDGEGFAVTAQKETVDHKNVITLRLKASGSALGVYDLVSEHRVQGATVYSGKVGSEDMTTTAIFIVPHHLPGTGHLIATEPGGAYTSTTILSCKNI